MNKRLIKQGTIAENGHWKIKVYAPPREHGPAHVHVLSKSDRSEVKISLESYEVLGKTRFTRKSIKKILKFIDDNYNQLMDAWEALHGKKKKT